MDIMMSRQDLLELYQLLNLYNRTYHPSKELSISEWAKQIEENYERVTNGEDIRKSRNPRKSGRKKKYSLEDNEAICEYKKAGKSMREIAKMTGCSLGHVQDVLKETK